MTGAFYILLVIGHFGFFDVVYYHWYRCRLSQRAECQKEVFWHTVRHLIYGLQFIFIANVRFHGAAMLALVLLYLADIFIAWSDVWEEPQSRKQLGGLPRGEYFMHIVLSLMVGLYLMKVAEATWPEWRLPSAVVVDPPAVPALFRLWMSLMGVSAIGLFLKDMYHWVQFRKRAGAASSSLNMSTKG